MIVWCEIILHYPASLTNEVCSVTLSYWVIHLHYTFKLKMINLTASSLQKSCGYQLIYWPFEQRPWVDQLRGPRSVLTCRLPVFSKPQWFDTSLWINNSRHTFFLVWRDFWGQPQLPKLFYLSEQPCWLPALNALEQHSPLIRRFYPSDNWLRSRCLTSVIVRELVFWSAMRFDTSKSFFIFLNFYLIWQHLFDIWTLWISFKSRRRGQVISGLKRL